MTTAHCVRNQVCKWEMRKIESLSLTTPAPAFTRLNPSSIQNWGLFRIKHIWSTFNSQKPKCQKEFGIWRVTLSTLYFSKGVFTTGVETTLKIDESWFEFENNGNELQGEKINFINFL
jgi:hypothetical protein